MYVEAVRAIAATQQLVSFCDAILIHFRKNTRSVARFSWALAQKSQFRE
jgi:hypothetical protein